jgi:hypothetical protein
MPKKRTVDEVLPRDAVQSVREETPRERIARLLLNELKGAGALLVIVLGLAISFVLALASEKLQMHAFQLLNAIVAAALGFFFAKAGR